jgi:hypothetical protein
VRILPFTSSGFTFQHVVEGDALNEVARKTWTDLHDVATEVHRDEKYVACEVSEGEVCFAVSDPAGDYYGTFALYRVRPVASDPDVVSALPAPMFPGIEFHEPPAEARDKDGEVVNAEYIEEIEANIKRYWRMVYGTQEYMTSQALPYEGGGALTVDHFRYPSTDDGDPPQHRWMYRDVFDANCKHTCTFDADGAAIRTTGTKTNPPDPERMFGAFL